MRIIAQEKSGSDRKFSDMLGPYPKLGVLSRIPFSTHMSPPKVGGLISTNHIFGALIVALNIYPLSSQITGATYLRKLLPPWGFEVVASLTPNL